MNKRIKINLIAGLTALSIIMGGYTLVKEKRENKVVVSFTNSMDYNNDKECEISVINNVIEEVSEIGVKLIDESGNVVEEWIQNDKTHSISNLKEGLYTIECKSENFGFCTSEIAITSDRYAEIYIYDGKIKIHYYKSQDNIVKYDSKLLLTKRK